VSFEVGMSVPYGLVRDRGCYIREGGIKEVWVHMGYTLSILNINSVEEGWSAIV